MAHACGQGHVQRRRGGREVGPGRRSLRDRDAEGRRCRPGLGEGCATVRRPPLPFSLSALPKAVGAATHAGGCVGCSGEIERVKPKKDSTVIVVAGDDKGQTGTLYGIDGDDGIVQLTDDIKILVLNTLAEHVPL